jgi:hypothetical protein
MTSGNPTQSRQVLAGSGQAPGRSPAGRLRREAGFGQADARFLAGRGQVLAGSRQVSGRWLMNEFINENKPTV